ncbi:MAG: hypothetical protein CM15mP85_24580 [Rhodobacterales bacterium]|nr:MAG: hypothetical protein CM15mP85_24580 [Rhodobacterales bacterium]
MIATAKGDPKFTLITLFAHPDSETVKNVEKWNSDPLLPISNNGKLFGWGVADDLAGCACAVEAIKVTLDRKNGIGRYNFRFNTI